MAVKAQEQITLSSVKDIKNTCRYYISQDSDMSAPIAPETYPAESPWTATEPEYSADGKKIVYFVDCTIFSDDTFSYSEVSKSSNYEAMTLLKIGARNLIRNSRNLIYADYGFETEAQTAALGIAVLGSLKLGIE